MFCPQCGAQAEASVKFCRACGLNLSEYERLSTNPALEPERENREQAEQEIRQVRGIRALVVASFFSLVTLVLVGLLAVIVNKHDFIEVAPTLLLLDVILSVLLGGWGIYNLWRGKFFKTRKERLINAYALLLEQTKKPGRLAPRPVKPLEVAETSSFHSPVARISVAEPTTRELQPMISDSGKIA